MCLAQGHNATLPVRLEPATLGSQVKHSTTALPKYFHEKHRKIARSHQEKGLYYDNCYSCVAY